MKKVSVFPSRHKAFDPESAAQAVKIIQENGAVALLSVDYEYSGIDAEYVENSELGNTEMLVVLGGDGSILGAAREFGHCNVPILGINHGRLGFLAELEKSDAEGFKKILQGDYTVNNHAMIVIEVGGKSFFALNDAVMHRGGFSRMIDFVIYVDDKPMGNIISDGLIVSTPTGSTAYSFSAGGPIADPALDVIIITPICPHDLNSRSIILPMDKTIRIVVKDVEKSKSVITIDGQLAHMLDDGEEIIIKRGGKVGLVRSKGSIFYDRLRKKLFEKNNGGC